MANKLLSTSLRSTPDLKIDDPKCDGVIIISHSLKDVGEHEHLRALHAPISEYLALNEGGHNDVSLIAVDKTVVPSGRVVYAGTGPVTRDQDDIRAYATTAEKAMKLALKAGMKTPLMATVPNKRYPEAELVAALGALHILHVPLNVREEENKTKLDSLSLFSIAKKPKDFLSTLEALEMSFTVCRDVGDADPQRMAPPRVAEYITNVFKGTSVKVHVLEDQAKIKLEYPLMAAVNRAANDVKDHQARLIWLEYVPEGPIEETLMIVGKGVTIDTGGTDLKTGGHMFGMCRDKYGSAIVAGFFKALDVLKPKGLKVVGFMAMVRNSIGANSYTTDEIIRARSGKRIHIYNTDAEGRITMLDPLTRMRELALSEKNPHLFTIATLTGHEILTYGLYAAIMDNGPARAARNAERIQRYGDEFGQPVEISRLHLEDYKFMEAECECADVRQGNTLPSVQTMRGHQSPAAFLIQASRLDEYGLDSKHPIKYSHVDMGSAMGDHPQISRPNPLLAFVATYVLPRTGYAPNLLAEHF